jgi:NitT/TauT family transport system substrate-binding protein
LQHNLPKLDSCAAPNSTTRPPLAARRIVDRGFTTEYDYGLQTLNEVPYNKWRDYDPEDTIRFFSLRLREVGMIKSNPNRIIAEGIDWRFLNELKRELKG